MPEIKNSGKAAVPYKKYMTSMKFKSNKSPESNQTEDYGMRAPGSRVLVGGAQIGESELTP